MMVFKSNEVTTSKVITSEVITSNPKETYRLGYKLGKIIKRNFFTTPGSSVIGLIGPLGSGKTIFVQGVVAGVRAKPYATSPTFKLINEYEGKIPVYHFDLYRLKGINDLSNLGYREYFYGYGVTLVEWAEKIKSFWPEECLLICFSFLKEKTSSCVKRRIVFIPYGKKYKKILRALKKFSPIGHL